MKKIIAPVVIALLMVTIVSSFVYADNELEENVDGEASGTEQEDTKYFSRGEGGGSIDYEKNGTSSIVWSNRFSYGKEQVLDRVSFSFSNVERETKNIRVVFAIPGDSHVIDFPGGKISYGTIDEIKRNMGEETSFDSKNIVGHYKFYNWFWHTYSVGPESEVFDSISFLSGYGEKNIFGVWIFGSFAGGSGLTGDPYHITNVFELQNISTSLSSSFVLKNNIDATITETWNGGLGFAPLGTVPPPSSNWFTGSFEGDGFVIQNLFINRSGTLNVGLFTNPKVGSRLNNLHFVGANITGDIKTGVLFGSSSSGSFAENISVKDSVINGNKSVGAIGGEVGAILKNSYSDNNVVTGNDSVGGLVGFLTGNLSFSYSNSLVINNSFVYGSGGLVGSVDYPSRVWRCFLDNQTSGWDNATYGRNTIDMKNIETYSGAGWSIATIENATTETWKINNTNDYPRIHQAIPDFSYIRIVDSTNNSINRITLHYNDTFAFRAIAYTENNVPLGYADVNWTATGGLLDNNTYTYITNYTAGTTHGVYYIRATWYGETHQIPITIYHSDPFIRSIQKTSYATTYLLGFMIALLVIGFLMTRTSKWTENQ